MKRAKFAVVGHPNKGKSSIVSTLAHNDAVEISPQSGTTSQSNAYKVETSRSGYQLYDTPGFQRPTKVLAWLKQRATSAEQRASAVAEFVTNEQCRAKFADEVALLTPIVNGAAILYVVDGSRPYGAEYETEMEILRWTGQPSMALINPIENGSHIEVWQDALAQYFKSVRVFNPLQADFEKQIELLKTFGHLMPDWSVNLELVTQDLIHHRKLQLSQSSVILARLIEDLCFYQQSQKVISKVQAELTQPLLKTQYQHWMIAREQKSIQELLAVYGHFKTGFNLIELTLPPDLFEVEHWYMWGLNKKQLALTGAMTGASAGAAVDLAVAGHSFMLGAIGGGLMGFGAAILGADKLVEGKIKGLPLGGFEAVYGPIKNRNFPYVIIGRFIYLHHQICNRSHAVRSQIILESEDLTSLLDNLVEVNRKALQQACQKLAEQKVVDNLEQLLQPLLVP